MFVLDQDSACPFEDYLSWRATQVQRNPTITGLPTAPEHDMRTVAHLFTVLAALVSAKPVMNLLAGVN